MITLMIILMIWLCWKIFKGIFSFIIPLILIVIGLKLFFGLWWLWLLLFLLLGGHRYFQGV